MPHINGVTFSGTSLMYIRTNVSRGGENTLHITETLENDLVYDDNLGPNAIVLARFVRMGKQDSLDEDIAVFNTDMKYLGS